ncbi:MAG: hypothetical protein J7L04_08550, partial [Bacteroidales bacterium]|nr:hypothetical protein [Bacteroidales bacterium]
MSIIKRKVFYFLVSFLLLTNFHATAQNLDNFKYKGGKIQSLNSAVQTENQFNGYTNHWQNTYSRWYRYGNLYKMAISNVEKTIMQSKVDIAEDLGIPGLVMQEGFMNGLLADKYVSLDRPTPEDLETKLRQGNMLVFVDPDSEFGEKVRMKLPENVWVERLKSHQYNAKNIINVNAFYLQNGERKVFVVSSKDENVRNKVKALIDNTVEVIEKYDLHKGWFGAKTLLKSVTCMGGHPLEVIGKGLNEGNSWFVFDGYMDFLAKGELKEWMEQVNLPVVTDVGFSPIYGCKDWDDFHNQSLFTKESWIDYARKKEAYIFRSVWDPAADPFHYDGYLATEGNKKQIDNEDVPFVLKTGSMENNALSSMVLFLEKKQSLSQESMWAAIMDRREVGILGMGKMMGPALYRNALQMLLLDRVFLEEYFGDRIDLQAVVDGYDLQVTITNTYSHSVSGALELSLPEKLKVKESTSVSINLPPGSSKTSHFTLQPTAGAMDNTNPVAVHYKWNGKKKSTLTMLDLPPAISVHKLLFGHAPKISYPVTIHNFTGETSFPVKVQLVDAEDENKIVYETSEKCEAAQATFKDMLFELEVPDGNYKVKVSALGIEYTSQLGVGKAEGKPSLYTVDLNDDGIDEYRMENDSVVVTLLATGARVIEYIIKSREDNALFKMWPKKAIDDKRPFRKRGYYPYGGFEDFLGQASMETHQMYNSEIVKKEGDYVRVRMWTDYYGNRLEKTFTLYGNSPLLEVRYALTFSNPEANVIAPVPILVLGKKHWTEDV